MYTKEDVQGLGATMQIALFGVEYAMPTCLN